MDIFECIKKRRSIRKYKEIDLSDDTILRLLDAARQAPFGGPPEVSCQPWEFVVIRDKKTKDALTHGSKERQFVSDAPVVIACCADTRRDPKYRDYDISVALAVENILLAGEGMGLGMCYVTCYGNHIAHERERKLLRDVLKLPKYVSLVCLVTAGYPDEEPQTKSLRELTEMIHYEHW